MHRQESGRQTVREKFKWSQQLQGIILSSYYWGYILLQLPGGVLAQKFGGKYILCGGIFLSAILSLITPWAIDVAGAYGLIVVRVLMGLCLGPLYPCISAFLVAWVPIGERGRLCSIIYMGSSVIHTSFIHPDLLRRGTFHSNHFFSTDGRCVFHLRVRLVAVTFRSLEHCILFLWHTGDDLVRAIREFAMPSDQIYRLIQLISDNFVLERASLASVHQCQREKIPG